MQIIRTVHTDKIAILEVESVQFIASLFCVHHIFIDHKSGAFGVARNALADLTVTRITIGLCEGIEHIHATWTSDAPYRPKFAKKVEKFFRRDVVAI